MIRHTFSMLNGIGEKLERKLWRSGILTWEDFVESSGPDFLSSERKLQYDGHLSVALAELDGGNSRYFNETLRRREHWRLFETFREDALYLDIETNGLMPGDGGYVTVVGLYDGRDYRALVRGENLSEEALLGELSGYKYLVTFFGAVFDIPFLQRSMGLMVNIPHFDLCFGAKRMGLRGGLKRIEESLGIRREEAVRGMDGYDAVLLWERARRGSSEALELLVAYNREDTVNLRVVAEEVYGGLKALTGIEKFVNGGGGGSGEGA
jgi:uncharacterized protein YprB with RNaseH-like and TPR domain